MRLFRNFRAKIKEVIHDPLLLLNLVIGPLDRLFCYYYIQKNTQKLKSGKVLEGPIRLDQLPVSIQAVFKKIYTVR